MQYKKVEGVLGYNTKTRNELLERNGGKYFMLDGQLEHPIGYTYQMYTRNIKHLTEEMPLQKFTIDNYSKYSDKIKFQYFNGIGDIEVFNTSGFTGEDFVRWRGKYVEYITLDVGNNGILNKDLGATAVFYHKGYDNSVSDDKQILGERLYRELAKWYNNVRPYIGDGRSEDDKTSVLLDGAFDGFNEYGTPRDLLAVKSSLGKRIYNVYGESDVPTQVGYARTIDERISEGGTLARDSSGSFMTGEYQPNEFGAYTHSMSGVNNLLKKTDELYNSHKIKTLFGRFHTSNDDGYNTYYESFDTAKVPYFGNPRGRGLLKLGVSSGSRMYQTNGYDDPYCRAWTYHHQYGRVKNLIRPLPETERGRTIYEANVKYRSRIHNLDQGGKYLHQNTVLQDTGFVRITPSASEMAGKVSGIDGSDYKYKDQKGFTKLKKYMFSIENLAWGDGTSNNTRNLSAEQLGPNNGRIMWFPPYNLDFRENVNVKWNSHEFIGRGENIYTYSNTTRKATLSFTLLIDHPALINSMAGGKYDGEEPDKDPEGDILRFFAGCQTPDPDYNVPEDAPPDIRLAEKAEEKVAAPKPKEAPNDEPKKEIPGEGHEIIFYVFFPNNYSGMWNGGKQLNASKEGSLEGEFNENAGVKIDPDWYEYLLYGSNAGVSGAEGRGFEMGVGGEGISDKNENNDVIKSWSINEVANFDIEKRPKNETTDSTRFYRYRVDYDLRQSGLKTPRTGDSDSSYYDTDSFGLNSSHQTLKMINKNDANYTFAEVFSALFGLDSKISVTDEKFNENVEKLKNIFNKDSGNIFSSIECVAGATLDDPKNARMLAKRRGRTVLNTIKKKIDEISDKEIEVGEVTPVELGAQKYGTINTVKAKSERYARIVIKYNEPAKTDMATTDANPINETSKINTRPTNTNVSGDTQEDWYAPLKPEDNQNDINPWQDTNKPENLTEYQENLAKENEQTYEEQKPHLKKEQARELLMTYAQNRGVDGREIGLFDEGEYSYEDAVREIDMRANAIEHHVIQSIDEIASANTNIRRYDDEYRFFRRLEKDSPLIFRSIVDKVKYFNPAFHSLSPEGFNARLTFLHQCTRQGHTVSASENSNMNISATAGNLAFGKMPVCVLRIGDFINTRVVIESMSIDYKNGDSMQWDLNQEGAGVQPMFANISMSIVLLGGQSLDGPINRLQNAVTFNYYANAPVYDDRADRIKNNYDGTITYEHLFTPFKDGEF